MLQGAKRMIDLNQGQSLQMDITTAAGETGTTWPFYVFLGGSMFCLLSSSICHLFSCHSHHLTLLLLQMDYVGIAVMIITSFFPPIYYIFQCSPHWQIVYLTGITVMGICTIITLLTPAFSTGKYRSFRACLFMAMGFSGLIPAVHALVVNWDEPQRNVTLAYEGAMGLFYITGTMFYITRVPERWMPGFFDLAGHSHQIFHVFVILGALAHYGAAQIFLEYRDSYCKPLRKPMGGSALSIQMRFMTRAVWTAIPLEVSASTSAGAWSPAAELRARESGEQEARLLGPELGVSPDGPGVHQDPRAFGDVKAAYHRIFHGFVREQQWRNWMKPEGFFDHHF
nr:heptahelical transmembrane protein 1-like [Ipomoea batatas]